jgi:CelD/BcsL family acetyltransferase involved in cellulose biosynthesis
MLKLLNRTQAEKVDTAKVKQRDQSHTITVISSLSALRALEQDWRDLEAHCDAKQNVFQSYDWVSAWADTYLDDTSSIGLHILTGYAEGKLVFLWPLMRARRRGLSVLTWLTDPFGQYGDILLRQGHQCLSWISSAISFMQRLKDVDILRLRHVREDSHLATCAGKLLCDGRLDEGAPRLDLTQFASEDAYEQRYTSIQRKRRKKIRKALEGLGPVTFTSLTPGSLADEAMRLAIEEKNQWLAERGRINRVLGCPGHLAFLKNLSRRKASAVDMVVTEIKAGNEAISWEVGFRYKGTHFAYITSHLNKYTDLSPGRLHMDLSQRACLAKGLQSFDLMVPNDAHKESWSSSVTNTKDYYLPLSALGAIVGHVGIRHIRPMVRNIYYSLDPSTLRRINPRYWRFSKTAKPE